MFIELGLAEQRDLGDGMSTNAMHVPGRDSSEPQTGLSATGIAPAAQIVGFGDLQAMFDRALRVDHPPQLPFG